MSDQTIASASRRGSRRQFLRLSLAGLSFAGAGSLTACSAQTSTPRIRFIYPDQGVRVPETSVLVQVAVRNFNLVRANQAARVGEGHVHFFIDMPASSIADGAMIPLDQPKAYIHVGVPPLTTRTLTLAPGLHTITAVVADSTHMKLASPAPVSVTFFVQPGGIQTK